jgi:hypothetical protein
MMHGGIINPAYENYQRSKVFEIFSLSTPSQRTWQVEEMSNGRASLPGEVMKVVRAKCELCSILCILVELIVGK